MKKRIKLVQVGGGSSYTPDFAEILINRRDDFPVKDWVLYDIDQKRNEIVGNFTKKFLQSANMDTNLITASDLNKAMVGADFVITTMRVGLSDGRIFDATIPPKHGMMIGQETTAPGGLAMGLRNIPVLLDVAEAMKKHASPGAWLINLANPSGMLMEALNQHSTIKFAGLCNGPTVFRKAAAEAMKADPKDVFCRIQGLNHLSWMKVYLKGEDVTEDAIYKLHEWVGENIPPLRTEQSDLGIQHFAGWIPMGPYLRYYYDLPGSVEDQKHAAEKWPEFYDFIMQKLGKLLEGFESKDLPTRAHMVKAVEERTLELYEEGVMEGYELARLSRGGRDYGEAGLSLASAIWNDKYEIHYPDVRHKGTLSGLDQEVVTTTTSLITKAGIFPLAMDPMPRHMMSFIQAAKNYELLAVEAAVTGNYHAALESLIANPLIVSFHQAKAALNELLVAHKQYLPLFSDSIAKIERGEEPL
jgi:6-phospho-beta-glucosidase